MGVYIRLTDYKNSGLKESEFFNDKNRYTFSTKDFSKIPGSPIAYWVSERMISAFANKSICEFYNIKQGLATTDNDRFVRLWHEVKISEINYNFTRDEAIQSLVRWFPFCKGGEFRKWFGNNEYVVNWQNDGKEIKDNILRKYPYLKTPDFVAKNQQFYFSEGLCFTAISSSNFGIRYQPKGFIYSNAGMGIFLNSETASLEHLLALCSTKVVKAILQVISSTLNFNAGDIEKIPFSIEIIKQPIIENNVTKCIELARSDWDSRETSWEFKQNELIRLKTSDGSMKSSIDECIKYWTEQFLSLHQSEEEINKIFIEIYGLQDELTPDVPLSDITILKDEIAERNEKSKTIKFDELILIKQFISYAVGCMVGRYSLGVEGLVYAGGEFDSSKYQTFKVDKDGIIPILPDDRFDDDITSRFREFVKAVFGEKNYSINIDYIANILGRKDDETAIECIRRYFLNDFYKDHVKMYKKRPIYWLYSSGKEKGFNAIVYMHRYKKETISILRMDYLHKLQRSYDSDYEIAERQEKSTSDSKQKIQLQKKMIYLKAVLQELKKYDELLRHYADKQVEIDLDDGVVVNYDKFKELLVKI